MTGPTRAEQETAATKIRTWAPDERRFVIRLPEQERDHVILLAALLDARPEDTDETR